MSDPNDEFLSWKINNGLFGWDHEYAELIDKAHQIGLTTAQTEYEAVRQQLEQAQARVAELDQQNINLAGAVLNNLEAAEFKPEVMSYLLRKQAEAVEAFLSELRDEQRKQEDDYGVSISHSLVSQRRLEDYAQRLHHQADELETKTVGKPCG